MSPLIKLLTETLTNFPEVDAAWLFGSAKEGIVRPGGDVDIGILLRTGSHNLPEIHLTLQRVLNSDDVDLVELTPDLDSILAFEVLNGARLLVRDVERVAELSSLVSRQYEDEMAYRFASLKRNHPQKAP